MDTVIDASAEFRKKTEGYDWIKVSQRGCVT